MDFSSLKKYVDSLYDTYGIISCDIAVNYKHKQVFRYSVGEAQKENLQWLYSMSKVITCTALMRIIERGELGLNDKVSDYLPEYADLYVRTKDGVKKAQNDLLIWHLFGMRSGMTYNLWSPDLKKARENENATTRELVAAMAKEPLLFEPGTAYNYSLSHDVLAAVAEVITGKTFHEFLKDEIFIPLGMTDIGFHPTEEDKKRFAKQYKYDFYRFKCNECPKTCAYRLSEKYESGGAGLYATNDEYMKVLDALANGGKAENGYQLLKPETIDMLRKQTMKNDEAFDKLGYRYAHGVRVMTNKEVGQSLSPLGEFGWDGAAGSYGLVDTENNISLVFTMNILGFGRCYSEIHPQLRNRAYIGLELDK